MFSNETDINDDILDRIARTPTDALDTIAGDAFFKNLRDEDFMRIAVLLAQKSYDEGGCPIGGVVIDNETRKILGKGHNMLVQNNDPLCHGETAAIRDAGRRDFSKTTLFTTLSPCGFMCTPSIMKLEFSRVVIGDSHNVDNTENEDKLRTAGIQIDILPDQMGIDLYSRYQKEKPEQDLEDWKGLAAVSATKATPECC